MRTFAAIISVYGLCLNGAAIIGDIISHDTSLTGISVFGLGLSSLGLTLALRDDRS